MVNLCRRQQYHVLRSPSEVPDILFGLNQIWIFPTGFHKISDTKFHGLAVAAKTDGCTYMTGGFLDYVNAPKTRLKVTNLLLFMQLSCLFFYHLRERDKHPVTNKTINLADPQALKQNCGEVQSNKEIRETDLEALRPREISCCHNTRRATSQDMQLHLVRMLSGLLEMSHFQTSARCYTLSEYTPTRAFQYFIAGFMTRPVEPAKEFGMNWNWTHIGSETNSGTAGGLLAT